MPELPTPNINSTSNKRVCAIVVAYYPDQGFGARLESILPQVDALVVVDNTPGGICALQLDSLRENSTQLQIIENKENLGIAAALNQGLEHSITMRYTWILTLDQDTQCFPDMVSTLLQVYEGCEPKPAVIGGNYLDLHNDRLMFPSGEAGDYLEQKTVITSGCLVNVTVASSVGGFREDFFIDQVDHEFCLRVRKYRHPVVLSRRPVMAHSVGNPGGARVPFLGLLPNHPPLRKYYIARNSIVTISEFWHQEPVWCLRRLTRLVLGLLFMATLEDQRLAKVRAFADGVKDGFVRRMGKYSAEK